MRWVAGKIKIIHLDDFGGLEVHPLIHLVVIQKLPRASPATKAPVSHAD
jgi:hypothetical protein